MEPHTFDTTSAERAIVTVGRVPQIGMGFLSSSGHVVTAAHVVFDYVKAFGDLVLLRPPTGVCVPVAAIAEGGKVPLRLTVYEPCSDVAVLSFDGAEDDPVAQGLLSRARLRVITGVNPLPDPVPVHVYSWDRAWVQGTATELPSDTMLHVTCSFPKGSSGSPALTDQGEVLGVVSNADGEGRIARLAKALPVWMTQRLLQ